MIARTLYIYYLSGKELSKNTTT